MKEEHIVLIVALILFMLVCLVRGIIDVRTYLVKVKGTKMDHVVVLRISRECKEDPMTNTELSQWILDRFEGCDYGKVSVDSINHSEVQSTETAGK